MPRHDDTDGQVWPATLRQRQGAGTTGRPLGNSEPPGEEGGRCSLLLNDPSLNRELTQLYTKNDTDNELKFGLHCRQGDKVTGLNI